MMESIATLSYPVIPGIQAGREYFGSMRSLWKLRQQISILNEQELPAKLRDQRTRRNARITML
jgi:hypothetical protein